MIKPIDIAVLSVGPMDEDQTALTAILRRSNWLGSTGLRGRIECCSESKTPLPALANSRIPIILCDENSGWRQMLEHSRSLPDPPFFIVSSRLADDHLWSEALNLGAYDVLAKPFDADEVIRVLNMAWIRWVGRAGESAARKRYNPPRIAASA